jgi:transposase
MREVGMNGKRVIGVDIGKRWLDAAWEGSVRVERYANDAAAITRLIEKLDPAQDIVVFERCGGWERNLEAALAEKTICWSVVHSRRVKAFREVQGVKAKTDAIDARLLRAYGRDRLDAGELRLGRREDVTLDALMARQRQLKSMLHAENCRLATAAIEPARASIERVIALLEGRRSFAALRAQASLPGTTAILTSDSNFRQPRGHEFAFPRRDRTRVMHRSRPSQNKEGAGNAG